MIKGDDENEKEETIEYGEGKDRRGVDEHEFSGKISIILDYW